MEKDRPVLIKEDLFSGRLTIYSLFSGYYKGELEILGKFTFSRGFETFFVNISTRASARVEILTKN